MNVPMRSAAAIVSAVVVAVLTVTIEGPVTVPLVTIDQGVTLFADDEDRRVFLLREGSIVTAFVGRSTARDRERIVYCPNEDVFVSPTDQTLWNRFGEWVSGPGRRDLDEHPVRVTRDLRVAIGSKVVPADGRSDGTVSGEAGERYARFRAGDDFAFFCQNPIPPVPDLVPTPESS